MTAVAAPRVKLPDLTRPVDPRDAEISQLKTRIRDLETLLGINEIVPHHVYGLSPCEASTLSLLLKRDFVGHDVARRAVSRDAESGRYAAVHVASIRRKLGDLRGCIQTSWGNGFFIEAKDKPRIRAWIAARGTRA